MDGEHLERGHELKVQLPGLAPVCAIPGSKLDGKYKAQVDKKMSTGDVSAVTETAVQINPTGSWGKYQSLRSFCFLSRANRSERSVNRANH